VACVNAVFVQQLYRQGDRKPTLDSVSYSEFYLFDENLGEPKMSDFIIEIENVSRTSFCHRLKRINSSELGGSSLFVRRQRRGKSRINQNISRGACTSEANTNLMVKGSCFKSQ